MSGLLHLVQKMPVQTGYCLIRGTGKQIRGTKYKNSSSKRLERLITLKKRLVKNDTSIPSN